MQARAHGNARGFSLPELMVVLSVIMLPAVLAIPDEEYTLTAKPVVNRGIRPCFHMSHQLGSLTISGGGLGGSEKPKGGAGTPESKD